MDIVSEKLNITAKDGGTFHCHVAKPSGRILGTIVIVQEIFGITDWLKSNADWIASNGYVAVVPDLFWRLEPNLSLDDKNQKDLDKAFKYYGEFDQDLGIEDLKCVVDTVRKINGNRQSVGIMGYCLGGLMSYLMATRSDVDCTVSYYGGGLDEKLNEADQLKKPILLHIPEEDKYITKDKQAKIKAALSANPLVTLQFYPGMDHAFARVGGGHYDKKSADLANSRSIEFFQSHLR